MKKFIALLLVLVMAATLCACAQDKPVDPDAPAFVSELLKDGKIVIATSPDYPPYESYDENGNMVPDPDGAYKILFRAFEKGLLVISLAGNRLRLQPPLNIKPENLKRGFEIIEEAIVDYKAGIITDECLKYRNGW